MNSESEIFFLQTQKLLKKIQKIDCHEIYWAFLSFYIDSYCFDFISIRFYLEDVDFQHIGQAQIHQKTTEEVWRLCIVIKKKPYPFKFQTGEF